MKKIINWAVVGTGGITNRFTAGLRTAEGARALAAVSRTKENAERFAAQYGIPKAYGSFDAMLADPEVDVVYIGTPHSTHKELAIRAFNAGKAVLCEKPVGINAGELAGMIRAARENKVFFMEAMWTRFVPPLVKAREWLSQGLIGEVRVVQANFGFSVPWNPEGRLLNPKLGGGALLDAGVYPISLASMVFGGRKPERVSSIVQVGETGVDEISLAAISYGKNRAAQIATALNVSLQNDAWIYGSAGKIFLPGFVFSRGAELRIDGREPYHWTGDFFSNGYNYQAEAVMDCLREGKPESEVMPLAESMTIMETMDAIRAQWGFKYPGEE